MARWSTALICGWCHGRRQRSELNIYRGHAVCKAVPLFRLAGKITARSKKERKNLGDDRPKGSTKVTEMRAVDA
jgi:hypothetical protein